MTHELDSPNPPEELNPTPHAPLAGDWHDDDTAAYEQDFNPSYAGPVESSGIPHAKNELPPETRLLSSKAAIGTVNAAIVQPVMLLPPDRNRKALSVQVLGANGDLVTLADSKTACYNGDNWQAAAGGAIVSLDGHTGAVWAYSVSANSQVVTALAVTV